jgi:hypothetical protein
MINPGAGLRRMAQMAVYRIVTTLSLAIVSIVLISPSVAQINQWESGTTPKRHRNLSNQPCVESTGFARALASNPKVFEHVVTAKNICIQKIRARACYADNDRCVPLEVPSLSRTEVVIGVFPSMKYFRYKIVELFD